MGMCANSTSRMRCLSRSRSSGEGQIVEAAVAPGRAAVPLPLAPLALALAPPPPTPPLALPPPTIAALTGSWTGAEGAAATVSTAACTRANTASTTNRGAVVLTPDVTDVVACNSTLRSTSATLARLAPRELRAADREPWTPPPAPAVAPEERTRRLEATWCRCCTCNSAAVG